MTQAADHDEVAVREAPGLKHFEIRVDDQLAGFTAYRLDGDRYAFTHTEIDSAFEGRGLGSVLIKSVLDQMRSRRIEVLPYCPFVRRYISRHTEYLDLVPAADRGRFDLPVGVA